MPKNGEDIRLDQLDLRILEILFDDARIPFRKLAKLVGSDQKTVARRVARLCENGIIKRFTLEVDYSKLGLNAMAYIGTRTTLDATVRSRLFKFFESQPRVLRVEATIGANEYVFLAIDKDIISLRENVNTPLEPLTAGLSTSVVSKTISLISGRRSSSHRILRQRAPLPRVFQGTFGFNRTRLG